MSFVIQTTTRPEDPASFIVKSILKQLGQGKRVLFFLTGGSGIAVGLKVSEFLKGHQVKNLTITLTDERYGSVGHKYSNWQQFLDKGFAVTGAKIIPVLIGEDRDITTVKFNKILQQELMTPKEVQYKIGLFGVGADGHTAGILPRSSAANSEKLALGYDTPAFSRITLTPQAIEKFDEAVVWMQGEEKWKVIESLEKDIDILKQPVQVLKKIPLLTIFTDFKRQ
jgi:6-phosphogluconolactonase/glucosamine-6-phosphate isomerase/deaminase